MNDKTTVLPSCEPQHTPVPSTCVWCQQREAVLLQQAEELRKLRLELGRAIDYVFLQARTITQLQQWQQPIQEAHK
jgi:hypothetical protein